MTSRVSDEVRLDAYHFHQQDWEDYDALCEAFEWDVPESFNIATYVCDRWAGSDNTALLVDDGGEVSSHSFADLQTYADQFAHYLHAEGVRRGDRVAVSGAQRVEVLAVHIACWKLGAVSVPLSVLFGRGALRYRLRDSGVKVCVITGDATTAFRAIKDDLSALETAVVVDAEPEGEETTFQAAIDGRSVNRDSVATDPADPATIIYTSGTTGDPKGVVLPHQHLLGVLPPALCGLLDLAVREDDVGRTPVEWSWAGSFVDVVLPLLYYGIPVVAADCGPFDPERELNLLERHEVTITAGPPTVYRVALGNPAIESTDLAGLRVLALGGEAAGDAIVTRAREVLPNVSVHEVYGQSEAPLIATDCEALGIPHRSGKMGKPGPGYEVRIMDPDTREPIETGCVGEFAVRRESNPGCFTQYWNDSERTATKVQEEWQFCEDLGSVDKDGYLDFHSRKDDVIISSGYRIGPTEVEESLAKHNKVANAGVIGVPDDTRGEVPKAFVVPTEDLEPTDELVEELQAHVKNRLAKHEYPREFEFVEELPKTTTGKIRRQNLRKREESID